MHIEIDNLSKIYPGGLYALDSVTLTISRGMFGLLGPNGAGKTTLLRILAGTLCPTNGLLCLGPHDGTSEAGRRAIKKLLGYLPQEHGIYPDLSAHEFLEYVAILKGIQHAALRRELVAELLRLVELSHVSQRKLKTYSEGMKRRVGIAQALLNNPKLLLVDEPTAGLDPEERIRLRNLLCELAAKRTVLLSTHLVEDVAQTCQRLVVLLAGRVAFQGTTSELLERTRGKVWRLIVPGNAPAGNWTVVSTQQTGMMTQYRIVGERPPRALEVEPTLEDAYIWLIRGPVMQDTASQRTTSTMVNGCRPLDIVDVVR